MADEARSIMEKVDAGKSTPKELVRLRQEGMSDKEVARMVGLPVQTTSEYYSRCKKEGEAFFG
jgi:transposase